MRIILTEAQYKLLEMINEVISGFSGSIVNGGYISISYMLGEEEDVIALKISNIYGNGQFIEGANPSGTYIFDLSSALSKDNNTFTVLKDGKYLPPQKNVEGKTISAPQIVGGSKMVLKNVTKIEVSDTNKNIADIIFTDLGKELEDTSSQTTKDREEDVAKSSERRAEKAARDEDIVKMAYNDPTIRKMMYYQPSLLGGLIKLGKAKGIAAVSDIINKAKNKEEEKGKGKTPKEFLKNKYYEFETLIPVTISHGLKVFKLYVGEWYSVQYDGNTFNGHAGERDNKISYTIKLQKKNTDGTYKAILAVKFIEKGVDRNTPNRIETKTDTVIIRIKNKG
jgi:hypothetical protein